MDRADVQRELAEWIRWTDREAAARGNGLTPESMEMNRLLRWYVKRFFHKNDVQSAQFKNSALQAVKEQAENCAGWLVVQSDNTSARDIIEASKILVTSWLGAREKNIAFHPMTQILEESPWRDAVRAELALNAAPQCIVRIGYVDEYPAPVSLRMPLREIIQTS